MPYHHYYTDIRPIHALSSFLHWYSSHTCPIIILTLIFITYMPYHHYYTDIHHIHALSSLLHWYPSHTCLIIILTLIFITHMSYHHSYTDIHHTHALSSSPLIFITHTIYSKYYYTSVQNKYGNCTQCKIKPCTMNSDQQQWISVRTIYFRILWRLRNYDYSYYMIPITAFMQCQDSMI